MTERERHDFTVRELTEERSAHVVTLAALAKSNDLLFAANRQIDELKRELADTYRATTRAQHAIASVLRLLGEANGRPRVSAPRASEEQIENDRMERRGGR